MMQFLNFVKHGQIQITDAINKLYDLELKGNNLTGKKLSS